MQSGGAIVLAALVALIVLLVAAFVWYNFTGWQPFDYQTGSSPSWAPSGNNDISGLRFKDCVFTVRRGDGALVTHDVTPVLNGMAVAYRGGTNNPAMLALIRPLNPFSFQIAGFNDRATVPDPTVAPWCSAPPPSCQSDSGCPLAVPGACGPSGTCGTCVGGATVSLTGQWRSL